jgi:hypothetical protein
MIRECILAGGILYVSIAIFQVLERPSILIESVVVCFALSFATAFYCTRKEHTLHASEAAALWAAVLLFAVYGMFKIRGAI